MRGSSPLLQTIVAIMGGCRNPTGSSCPRFGRAWRGRVHAGRVRPGVWKTDTRLGVACLPQAMPTGLHPSVDGRAAHKCAQPLSTTRGGASFLLSHLWWQQGAREICLRRANPFGLARLCSYCSSLSNVLGVGASIFLTLGSFTTSKNPAAFSSRLVQPASVATLYASL